MAKHRRDKIMRAEKSLRDKRKKDALKKIEKEEKKKNPEDLKKIQELWLKLKKKNERK